MDEDQQNIVVAKECGWNIDPDAGPMGGWLNSDGIFHPAPPNYLKDYNAVAEMRKTLLESHLDTCNFIWELRKLLNSKLNRAISDWDMLNSTPADQVEAYIRGKNLWAK